MKDKDSAKMSGIIMVLVSVAADLANHNNRVYPSK